MSNSPQSAAPSRAATAFDFDVVTDVPKLRSRPPETAVTAPAIPREKLDETAPAARS
jgi:hypothetical protein